jgi:hypothetical protein
MTVEFLNKLKSIIPDGKRVIVIITYWVIGVVGYSQGMQRIFQPNTVKDKKIYSYFTLGKFIIDNYLHTIKPLLEPLAIYYKDGALSYLISWGHISSQ